MHKSLTNVLAAAAVVALTWSASAMAADTYKFDPSHTSIVWKSGHMGFSHPHGIFPMVEGTLVLDEEAPENSTVNVTVDTAKIVTGIPKFDDHLKSKDFFNVTEHPAATFVSKSVDVTGDNTAKVTGDLTLLGVTKPVTLDVTLNKKGQNPMSKQQAVGFSATGTIKRSDFGINYGIPNVPDEVELQIEAEAGLES